MNKTNEVPLVLTTDEVKAALRCCATTSNDGGGCINCSLDKRNNRLECSELICLMGADRIGELQEELRKLRDATEGICQRETSELIRLAGEANTALERGLVGVNEELFSRMLERQTLLTGLGRESAIQAEPTEGKGWHIVRVAVDGRRVFGEEEAGDVS